MYAHGSELQYFGKSVHDTGCESLNTLISKQSIKVALYDDHIVTKDADLTPDERFNAQNDFCVNMFYLYKSQTMMTIHLKDLTDKKFINTVEFVLRDDGTVETVQCLPPLIVFREYTDTLSGQKCIVVCNLPHTIISVQWSTDFIDWILVDETFTEQGVIERHAGVRMFSDPYYFKIGIDKLPHVARCCV